jgi:hypothetical protein
MDEVFFTGTREGDALVDVLGHEAVCTLRIALRRAAAADLIGDEHAFRALYNRIGGRAPEMSLLVENRENQT